MTGRTDRETCPICGAPTSERLRPFCSRRCADVDLGRWLTGAYVIPVDPDEADDLEGPSEPDRSGHGSAG